MSQATETTLRSLINAYGRACRRDGNPAWASEEGKALDAALSTAAAHPPLPPGWVAVPVEPTAAMVQAAHRLDLSYMPGRGGTNRAAVYGAMLAAAPKPPTDTLINGLTEAETLASASVAGLMNKGDTHDD